MGAKTDFWLALHNACLCYENEGDTLRERTANVANAWASMPSSARTEMVREMRFLLAELQQVDAELMLRAWELASDGNDLHLFAANGSAGSDGKSAR